MSEIMNSKEYETIENEKKKNCLSLYIDDLLFLNNLPKGFNKILKALLKRKIYNNQLVINAALKRQIAKEIGLSTASISNAMTSFVKEKILIREDTGLYTFNPIFFGDGEWNNIEKIELNITFDENGKRVIAKVEKHEDVKIKDNTQSFKKEPGRDLNNKNIQEYKETSKTSLKGNKELVEEEELEL